MDSDMKIDATRQAALSAKLTDKLTDKEEQLLMMFVDNECRWCGSKALGRMRAQRLLNRKQSARQFVENLSGISSTLRSALSFGRSDASEQASDSLWHRIENRIEQEERAALFLGQRSLSRESQSEQVGWRHRFGRMLNPQLASHFAWGASGAAVGVSASLLGLFIVTGAMPWKAPSNSAVEVATGASSGMVGAIQPIAMRESDKAVQPTFRIHEPRSVNVEAVQVEWMRSRGRVQVMNDPRDNSAIFWVRRQPNRSKRALTESVEGESNPIRIIEDTGPGAIAVRTR